MRKDKDEQSSVSAGFREICHGHNVLWKFDSGQVLDILMLRVDDFRQFATLAIDFHRFFIDPHVYLVLEVREPFTIKAHFSGDC